MASLIFIGLIALMLILFFSAYLRWVFGIDKQINNQEKIIKLLTDINENSKLNELDRH